MPIYEYLCTDCTTIFNFLTRGEVSPEAVPVCPGCGSRSMEKQFSLFATSSGNKEALVEDVDEKNVISAFSNLLNSAEKNIDVTSENMVSLLKQFGDDCGVSMGETAQKAIDRLAKGENVDDVKKDCKKLFDQGALYLEDAKLKVKMQNGKMVKYDETLYEFTI